MFNDQDEIFFGFLTCSFIENLSFLITEKNLELIICWSGRAPTF